MDVHVPYAISAELRRRGIDVLTAQEEGASEFEASRRQRTGTPFSGVIYAHQRKASIGECVHALELIAQVCEPQEWASRVEYLPLK